MKKKFVLFVTTLALLALSTGCTVLLVGGAVAAGAGGYAYVSGEARSTEAASLDRTWTAAKAAIKDLKFSVVGESKDALEGKLTARTAADKKVTVGLKKVSDKTTEVRIRVGTFGDETVSRMILEKIKQRL